jgi:DNA-binding transcriptional LysR family regulator
MRDLNLRSVDLNLLPALDALLRLRHVTRAAEEVGLSQPAMSHMLGRLRQVLGDDLLVRGPAGLALTARAAEIAPRVAAVLNVTRTIYRPPSFDISKVRRVLHVVACDLHSVLFGPPLMNRIREEAPGIELSIENYTRTIFKRLEEGSVDLVFADAQTPLPPGAVSTVIGEDRYALVMREKHPAAGKKWTVAEYGKWDSAVVSIFGDGQTDVDARKRAWYGVLDSRRRTSWLLLLWCPRLTWSQTHRRFSPFDSQRPFGCWSRKLRFLRFISLRRLSAPP